MSVMAPTGYCVNDVGHVLVPRRLFLLVILVQLTLFFLVIMYNSSTGVYMRNDRHNAESTERYFMRTNIRQALFNVNTTSTNRSRHSITTNHSRPIRTTTVRDEMALYVTRPNITKPRCPIFPPYLRGTVPIDFTEYDETILGRKLRLVGKGGVYRPSTCRSRNRVAIIIPYRNRKKHLRILLNNLHPFLQRQQLDYGIFVIELAPGVAFNRALCLNIGFLEASKRYGYKCFIFHDVDLIPENDNNMYSCLENPRHMSVAVDTFDYKLPYTNLFGGVTAMTKDQFEMVNGYSNKFFGWGGEDDDIYKRIRNLGVSITRYTPDVSSYRMLGHTKDPDLNNNRFLLLGISLDRWNEDGLNTIKYEVIHTASRRLYTYILADINQDDNVYQPWKTGTSNQSRDDSLDPVVEDMLIDSAKYLLNRFTLDVDLVKNLKREFRFLNTSNVTMSNVAGIIQKLFPIKSLEPMEAPQVIESSGNKSSINQQTGANDNGFHSYRLPVIKQNQGTIEHMQTQYAKPNPVQENQNHVQPVQRQEENQNAVKPVQTQEENQNPVQLVQAQQNQQNPVQLVQTQEENQNAFQTVQTLEENQNAIQPVQTQENKKHVQQVQTQQENMNPVKPVQTRRKKRNRLKPVKAQQKNQNPAKPVQTKENNHSVQQVQAQENQNLLQPVQTQQENQNPAQPVQTQQENPNPVQPVQTQQENQNPVQPVQTQQENQNPVQPVQTQQENQNPVQPVQTQQENQNPVQPVQTQQENPNPVQLVQTQQENPNPVQPVQTQQENQNPVKPVQTRRKKRNRLKPVTAQQKNQNPAKPVQTKENNHSVQQVQAQENQNILQPVQTQQENHNPAQPVQTQQENPNPVQPVQTQQENQNPVQPVQTQQENPNPVQPVQTQQENQNPVQPVQTQQENQNPVQPVQTQQENPNPVQLVQTQQENPNPVQPVQTQQENPNPVQPVQTQPENQNPVQLVQTQQENQNSVQPVQTKENQNPVQPVQTKENQNPVLQMQTKQENKNPVQPLQTKQENQNPVRPVQTQQKQQNSVQLVQSKGRNLFQPVQTQQENQNLAQPVQTQKENKNFFQPMQTKGNQNPDQLMHTQQENKNPVQLTSLENHNTDQLPNKILNSDQHSKPRDHGFIKASQLRHGYKNPSVMYFGKPVNQVKQQKVNESALLPTGKEAKEQLKYKQTNEQAQVEQGHATNNKVGHNSVSKNYFETYQAFQKHLQMQQEQFRGLQNKHFQ